MKITGKQAYIPALLAICAGYFLHTCFSGVIYSRELFQMFLFTREYFCEVCRIPGGPAEYLGRFFNQFFYCPVLGAIIYAGLIWLVQYLVHRNMNSESNWSLGLSLTVFGVATWYIMSKDAATGTLLSVSIILATVKLLSGKHKWCSILITPILFYICGPSAIIFPVILWLKTERHAECLTDLFLCLCGSIAMYMAYPFRIIPELWILSGCLIFIIALEKYVRVKSNVFGLAALAACITITLCAYFPCRKNIPEIDESFFEYIYLEGHGQWNRIIAKSERARPDDALSMQVVNLALAQKGMLLDKAFKYKRNKSECIVTKECDHHVFPLASAEMLFYLDKPNLSQQYWFDLMQAIPAKQKSSRAYQRIAECNALSGNRETAIKYASALSHTLFYRKWAKEFVPDAKSGYCNDDFYPEMNLEELFVYTFRKDGNEIALQYAVLNALMAKDLNTALGQFDGFDADNVPDCCQQAFMLSWMQRGGNLESLPSWINTRNRTLWNDFGKNKKEGLSANRMYSKFGGSYLFYYIYYK